MPELGPRVIVGGISGSGKTTVAAAVARHLDAPHVELDSLIHGPGWVERPDDVFFPLVAKATAGERWVVDGNYSRTREITWPRATDVVLLDYRRGVATWRALRRTVVRLVRGTELWNGNRERLRNVLDPGHPIWWSWTAHGANRVGYEEAFADPRWAHVNVVRLRSPRETARWLRSLRS